MIRLPGATVIILVAATASSCAFARSPKYPPDFADGLSGGPDYWEVTGVPSGDALSLRATASPKGKLVTRAANGAPLKNLGCKFSGKQRWCHVEDGAGHKGWANGRYLREGPGPSQ